MKKWVFYLLIGILVAAFVTGCIMVGLYYWDAHVQQSRYDELAKLRPVASLEGADDSTEQAGSKLVNVTDPDTGETVLLLPEFLQLYEMNNDIIGWLTVPGISVDYPVMQTPDDPQYYLRRNFDKKSSTRGCLFAFGDADVFTPSDNVTIFGHRMQDGTMFGQLKKYKEASFRDENPYIYFDTLTEHHTYEIFAVFRTTASVEEGFAYHEFVNAASEKDFLNFVANCQALSMYETDVSVSYGDKLLCLSTCEYSLTDGRLVVVAKRIK